MTGSRLHGSAAVIAGVAFMSLVSASPAQALDDCGVGMYYNNANEQCEPWAPVGVGFTPAADVAGAALDVAGAAAAAVPLGIGFDPVPLGIGFDPGFGLNVPNIAPYLRVPNIGVPGIGVPGIGGVRVGIPNVGIPDVRVPDVRVPDVRVPDVRVPDVRVPDVRVPEVHVPEIHGRR